jgi:hypothetical protein
MKEFMAKAWKIITDRITSPIVIFGLIAQILVAAQISPSNLTSWGVLWDNIVVTVSNPYVVGLIIVEIVAFFNNPADKQNF